MHKKVHDYEITSLKLNKNHLSIIVSDSKNSHTLVCQELIHIDLSPFYIQNVIFDIYYYDSSKVPEYLVKDYPDISAIKKPYQLIHIDASTGLGGLVVCKKYQWD